MNENPQARAAVALIATLGVYATMVLLFRGDVWPFSVFPMYSSVRETWSRPMLVEVSPAQAAAPWRVTQLDDLPGHVFSLHTSGIDRHTLRRMFFTRTQPWSKEEILSLRSLIGEDNIRGRRLLLIDARGRLREDGATVECVPLVLFTDEGTSVSPAFEA
jgi:hypothetical protein